MNPNQEKPVPKLEGILVNKGDTHGENGTVIPGQDLRARMGLPAATKPEPKPEENLEPEVQLTDTPPKDPKSGRFVKQFKKVVKPAPSITAKEISTIASEAATAAVRAAQPEKKADPAPADPLAGLTPDDKYTYDVLIKLAEMKPEAYKGTAEKYAKSVLAFTEYKSEWAKKNKGRAFNIDDPEHADFVSANDVQYNERDFNRAAVKLEGETIAAEKMKPIEDRLAKQQEEQESQQRKREMEPRISAHKRATAMTLFQLLGDDFKDVLNAQGVENPEKIKELVAARPIMRQVFNMALDTEAMAGELMSLASGLTQFDAKNPIHNRAFNFVGELEKQMMNLPDDRSINEKGQTFVPSLEYSKMDAKQREDHWTFNDQDLSIIYAQDNANRAKKILEEDDKAFNDRLTSMGYQVPTKHVVKPTPAPAPAQRQVQPALAPQRRAASPAGSVAPKMAPAVQNGGQRKNTLMDRIRG